MAGRSGHEVAVGPGAAAIHDLGYKRYLGTRRPQSTRWRVLVKNVLSTSWRGWWRMKVWVGGSAIATVVIGVMIYLTRTELLRDLVGRGMAAQLSDQLLTYSFNVFPFLAFLLTATTTAGAVARDLGAGAFEFYFSRPVRPIDYVLGKIVGSALVVSTTLLAGPLLLSLFVVALSPSFDEVWTALAKVPPVVLAGLVGSVVYAVVALAFSSLSGRPRITTAIWAAFYLLFGQMAAGLSIAMGTPDVAALNLPSAVKGLAAGLLQVTTTGPFDRPAAGLAISCAVLVAYTAIGLVIINIRVKLAERAGLGGG